MPTDGHYGVLEANKVAVAEEIRPDTFVVVVEPFSWAAIAKWFIQAALSAIGNALLRGLLGKPVNLKTLFQDFTAAFAAMLGEALLREALRKATNDVDSLKESLLAYTIGSETRRSVTLGPLLLKAESLYSDLDDIGVQGTAAFTVAAALRFAINAELYRETMHEGDLEFAISRATTFRDRIPSLHQELIQKTLARFSEVQHFNIPRMRRRSDDVDDVEFSVIAARFYYYKFDGRIAGSRNNISRVDVEAERNAHINRLTQSLVKEIIVPANAVAISMTDKASTLKKEAS